MKDERRFTFTEKIDRGQIHASRNLPLGKLTWQTGKMHLFEDVYIPFKMWGFQCAMLVMRKGKKSWHFGT